MFIYVCSQGKHELYEYIFKNFPDIASVTTCAATSVEAMRAVPKKGKVVVLTSNDFYNGSGVGADKKPEEKMTGVTLARLIKNKNPQAKVYLFAERTSNDPILNGAFKRDTKVGIEPSEELKTFLENLEKEVTA